VAPSGSASCLTALPLEWMRPGRCSPAHLRNGLQRPPGGPRGKEWRRPSWRRGSRWSSAVALRAAIKTSPPQIWGSSRDGSSSGSHGGPRQDPAGAAEEEGEKGRGGTDPRVDDGGPDRRVVAPARHAVAGVERGRRRRRRCGGAGWSLWRRCGGAGWRHQRGATERGGGAAELGRCGGAGAAERGRRCLCAGVPAAW
jgi:hypothetical protein